MMTYILVSKSEESRVRSLDELLSRVFEKEMSLSPDIHILDPEEKNSIGIEEIKDFQKTMIYKPFQEKIQAGIILQAEKLTPQAQNALLKTLEESSEFSIFILCVSNEKNLLPTIRSRGQVTYASQSEKTITEELTEGDVLKMSPLEQFNIVEKYSKGKVSSIEFINAIEEVFKQRLELDIKNGNIDSSRRNISFLKVIQDSRAKISANCNKRLTLEAMLVQLNA